MSPLPIHFRTLIYLTTILKTVILSRMRYIVVGFLHQQIIFSHFMSYEVYTRRISTISTISQSLFDVMSYELSSSMDASTYNCNDLINEIDVYINPNIITQPNESPVENQIGYHYTSCFRSLNDKNDRV